jgi:PAS domain S-box-containing protein
VLRANQASPAHGAMNGNEEQPNRTYVSKWWRLPGWNYYAIAVAISLVALGGRYLLDDLFATGRGAVLFVTISVAVAAFLGGLGPGVLAAIIGLVGSAFLFIEPVHSLSIASFDERVNIGGFGIVWVFISIICDYMRRVSLRLGEETQVVQDQRHKLDSILSSITDGFFSVDRDWNVSHCNEVFLGYLHRDAEDLKGVYIWDMLGESSYYELRVRMTESMRTGEPFTTDVHASGLARWLHVRGFPMSDGMFVYVQDMTDRKQLEESRERMIEAERAARADAESMNRMKDEFVATLSHELRTPLTTILGWTEVLQRLDGLDARVTEGLEVIGRSVRHQAQLIDDLLDMSRISTGKLKLDLNFVDLSDTAYEAVGVARPTAESKGVDLEIEVRNEDTIVRGDAQRLYQILTNLLSNAIKFTPKGGKVQVEVWGEGDLVHCAVTDTGEGIEPAFLPHLFDRFRQKDASAARRHGGLGLGLAIVKQLTELHGGEIAAQSQGKGTGSRFELHLPMASAPSTMLFTAEPRADSVPNLEGVRILAVDDDPDTRQLLEKILADSGAEVTMASSGREALERLEKDTYDVILSDIGMPEMDGYEFLRRARAKFDDLNGLPPAVALTAFAHERDFVLSAEAGFTHHLTKPVDISRLIRTLHAASKANIEAP